MIRISNTMTRTKEEFAPLASGEVRMYVCGVTVYDYSHIGHARSAMVFDVIRRYLTFKGYRVTFVKNYTDVDDRIIKRANDAGVTAREFAERFIAAEREDMASLGVLADLAGKPAEAPPPVADRKFLAIDVDNFDSRMKAMKPRVAFQVPNTLTGEGNMNVELTFESMDDFSPAAIAKKVDSLGKLLTARNQLSNLITYMDGKSGAEELVSRVLQDPALLQSLAASKKPTESGE
jgi:type VI secretion system protein ImpB